MIIFKAKWRPVYDSNYCQRFCGGNVVDETNYPEKSRSSERVL